MSYGTNNLNLFLPSRLRLARTIYDATMVDSMGWGRPTVTCRISALLPLPRKECINRKSKLVELLSEAQRQQAKPRQKTAAFKLFHVRFLAVQIKTSVKVLNTHRIGAKKKEIEDKRHSAVPIFNQFETNLCQWFHSREPQVKKNCRKLKCSRRYAVERLSGR